MCRDSSHGEGVRNRGLACTSWRPHGFEIHGTDTFFVAWWNCDDYTVGLVQYLVNLVAGNEPKSVNVVSISKA